MAKKGQSFQLQVEVNTEEDWEKLLQREGLIVVDVYSEWCGPCSGMSANLKKIKLEVGGDTLHLAMAKANNISALERFREKSEPTWMFISKGKMINLMFGPNAPKLQRMVLEELENVRGGLSPKMELNVNELAEEERERKEKVDRILEEEERVEKEAKTKAHHERLVQTCKNILTQYSKEGVALALPNCKHIIMTIFQEQCDTNKMTILKVEKVKVTRAMCEELYYFSESMTPCDMIAEFSEEESHALLIGFEEEVEGDTLDMVLTFLFGEMRQPPGSKDCAHHKIYEALELEQEEAEAATKALAEIAERSAVSNIVTPVSSNLQSKVSTEDKVSKGLNDWFVWAPKDQYTKAMALKLFFPKLVEQQIVPEPEPIPPHIAIVFDATKRKEVIETIEEWSFDVMRYGFFTSDVPEDAKLIAKSINGFLAKAAETQYGEKLILQLSKKRSDALLAFAQLGPSYISPNVIDGKKECKLFFPEGYDDLVDEEAATAKKKIPKKLAKQKSTDDELPHDAAEEEHESEESIGICKQVTTATSEETAAAPSPSHEEQPEELSPDAQTEVATSAQGITESPIETIEKPVVEPPEITVTESTHAEA